MNVSTLEKGLTLHAEIKELERKRKIFESIKTIDEFTFFQIGNYNEDSAFTLTGKDDRQFINDLVDVVIKCFGHRIDTLRKELEAL